MDTFLNNLVRRRYPTSDTAAKLATLTGVPTADDWFHETDTGRFKFADGQRTYTELPYAPVGLTTSVVLEAYGTSVTPGQPIALRVEGVGEVISENSGNVSRWIGIAETGASVNEKFTCTVFGGINRDMSGLVPGSYYYFENDGTLTTTTTPYFVGRAILSTELLILNTGRGSILSNNPPDQPINISPVSGATNVTQTPTLVSSGFSSSGDTHAKSRWQVSTVSNFASILYDSGAVDDLTSHTLTTSSVNLQNGTIYYWRVKHEGTSTGWSDWSLATPLQVSVVSGVQWWIVPGVYTWQCPEGVFEVDIAIAPDTEPTSFSNLLVGSAVAVQGWTNGVNLPEARADGAAVSDSDGNIYYFGGVDSSDAASQKAFKFNVSTNQWSNLADVPGGLAQDVVAVSVGNLIYIYSTSTNAVGNFMVYNTALNTYTNLNALAVNNVHYTTINAANGFVYVFGGTTGTDHRDEIQKYNIATGSWSVLSSRLPQGVYGLKTGKDAQGNIKLWGGQGSSGNPLNLLTFYIDTETVVNTGPNLPAPTDERQPGCSDSQGNLYSFGIHNSPSPAPYGVFYKLAAGASSWQPFETPSQIQGSGAVAVCTPSNNIHIIAGRVAGASGQSDLIQKINLNGNSWTQNTSLPGPRDQFGIAIDDNDNIYVFGGQDANMYLANGYKYTKLTQQWTPIANMSVTRANITGVRVGNKIFTFGGTSTNVNVLNSAESYNITTDTWANIQPIPGNATLQAYGAVALSDDKVYITGGNNSAGADNVSYKYDPTTNVFSNISGMAYAIVEHGMVVDADDAVWVVGGNANEGSGFSSFLYKYDIGNVGVPNPGYKAPLPQPVVDAAVCIDKTKGVIYVIGGYNNTGHLSTVYEYTIATNVWRTLPPIPLKLRSAGAVVDSSGVIWLVGGNDESTGRKATVYTYDPVGFDFDGETEILTGNGFNFTGPSIVSTPGLSGVNSKVAAIGRAKAVVPLTNYTVSVGGPSGAARVEWGPQVSQAGEQIYTTSGTFNFVVPQGVTSMSALAIPNLDSVSVGTLLSTTKLSSSSSSTSNTYTTSQSVTVPVGITNVTMIGNNTGPIIPSLTIDSATNLYRRTHIGVESSNRIYLLGGRNYNGSSIDSSPGTRIVQRFNISTNQVERLQDLPEALDYFTAVADQTTGNIYVFGGVNLTSANNSLKSYKFDVNTSQWTTLADLPFSLIYASGVYFNSPQTGGAKIYLVNGLSNENTNVVRSTLIYNILTNTFTVSGTPDLTLSGTPNKYVSHTLVDGYDIYALSNNVGMFKFSMQNQQWSTMTSPFNAPIFQNDGYAFNGKIYTYVNHVFNDLNDTGLYEYTPSTNTWVKLLDGTQLTLQSNHSLVGSSDRIFFPNTQRVYDIATNSLMSLTGTPFNQTSATAYNQSKFVRVQDRVYSVGSATVITANYTEVNTIQVLDTTRYKRWGSAGNHGSSVSGLEDSRFTITNTGVLKGVGTNGHFTIDSVTNAFTLTPYASGSGAANQGSITRDGTIYYLVTDGISGATNKQRALYRYNPVLGTSTRLVGIDNAYLYNGQQVNSSASDCILFVTHDNYVVVWDNNIASHGPASSYHVYNIATSTMSRQTKPIISAGSYMRINDNASVMFCYGTYGVSDDGFHIYLTAQSLMRFVGGTAVPIPSDSIMQNGTVLIALSMTDVYVNAIGGVAYKQLKKYSLQSNSWSALPDLPENILNNPNDMIQSISGTKASTGFYGVVRHSGPYLNGANYIEQIVKFNGTAWQRFSNKPVSPRMTGTLIDVGSKVYILGGESNTGDEPFYTQPAQTYDAYDLSSGSWKKSGDSAGYSGQMSATLDSQNYNFAPGEITTHTVILSGATSKTLQMTIPSGSQISVTTNASEWSSLAAPSIQRAEHMTAIGSDGKIYVFGGRDNNNNLTSGERYDPSANSWSSITPMTTERNFGRAVGDSNGNIYIIGGKNGANVPIDTVLKYSIASNSYTTVANLPVALTHIAVAIDSNNNIYVVGGLNASNSDVNTVYKYNPVVNEWTTIANMSVTRSLAGAAVIEGFLYIYGGGNANNAYLSSGEKLNLANSNFSPMASDVGVRNHTFVLDKQGRLYVIGGSTSSEGVSNKVRIYDTFSNTWSSGTNMTTGVFSTYGVSDSNGVICIVGGYSAVSTTSSLVQKYTPNNSFSFSNTNGTRSGNGFDVTGNLTSPGTYGTQSRRAGWRNGISVNPGDNISITIPTGGAVRIIWGSGKSFPDNAVV